MTLLSYKNSNYFLFLINTMGFKLELKYEIYLILHMFMYQP